MNFRLFSLLSHIQPILNSFIILLFPPCSRVHLRIFSVGSHNLASEVMNFSLCENIPKLLIFSGVQLSAYSNKWELISGHASNFTTKYQTLQRCFVKAERLPLQEFNQSARVFKYSYNGWHILISLLYKIIAKLP